MINLKGEKPMPRMARTASQASLAVLLAGLLVGTGGCANTNNRDEDTRGASLLLLDQLVSAGPESDFGGTAVFSDVCDDEDNPGFCGIINDNAEATFRNVLLDPNGDGSFYQDITLYRYHVQYHRSDGQNIEGIDVPFAFDGVMTDTVEVGGSASIPFIIVRHVAKIERPLVDLVGVGDDIILSTITRVDFYGRDIAGNGHQVHGWIDIEFGDYAENN